MARTLVVPLRAPKAGRRWPIGLLALVLVATALVVGSLPTGASPYGADPGGVGYYPDSTDHWYCFDSSVPGANRARYDSAMANVDAQTVMYDVVAGSCGYSTDVKYYEANPIPFVDPNTRGWAPCHHTVIYAFCDQVLVFVNPAQIWIENGGFGGDATQFEVNYHKTIRHETGHSIGLGHWNGVHAMESGHVPINYGYIFYNAHDVCHVNTFFSAGC
jgi:Peptidase M66